MASAAGPGDRAKLQDDEKSQGNSTIELTTLSRGGRPTGGAGGRHSPDPTSSGSSASEPLLTGGAGTTGSTKPKTTRTRTVKSRDIFTPEDDTEKKPKGKGKGRRIKRLHRKSDLKNLLEDEKADVPGGAEGDGSRRRSRNESDGENRWDRIRAKVKLLLQKIRRDSHYIEVYQHDGWKSSGREKLKPTIELHKAKERVKGVKAELRQVVQRLTEMNPNGSRWRNLKQDNEGNIRVDEVVCSKCNKGDSDDNDDILLCDYAGCFRAFHQNCLTPPIKPEAFPSPSEDWFCWQCECLTDCMKMIEDEFPGSKFRTWEDVFPDVEAGEGQASGQNQDMLLTDSDDSDDESFKGSSSESEGEETRKGLPQEPEGNESGPSENSAGSKEMGNSSDEDLGVDEDMVWMSDAESVGSDEVAKLQTDAADMADIETDKVGEGDTRASRALARRKRRSEALGLPDDTASNRTHAADLVRGEKVDASNIMHGRRGRKPVDYVKLNEAIFGNEEVYGDHASSDPQHPEKSEGHGSDEYEDLDPCEDSDASIDTYRPRRKSTLSIDPLTGEARKRGRPKKSNGSGVAAGQPNRKLGRPRKNPGIAVAEHGPERPAHMGKVTENVGVEHAQCGPGDETPLQNGARSGEQNRGWPRINKATLETSSVKDDAGTGTGRDTPVLPGTAPPALGEDVTNGEAGDSAAERKPCLPRKDGAAPDSARGGVGTGSAGSSEGRRMPAIPATGGSTQPTPASVAEEGASSVTEKRRSSRPRKDGVAPGGTHVGVGAGSASNSEGGRTHAKPVTNGSTQLTHVGARKEGASDTTEKRKRGRPRKDGAAPGGTRVGVGAGSVSNRGGGRAHVKPVTNGSTQPAQAKKGANDTTEKRKRGRPRKDGAAPGSARGGVGIGSAKPTTNGSTQLTHVGVVEEGANSMTEKRESIRLRKGGVAPGDAHVGVGGRSASNSGGGRSPAKPVTCRSTLETGANSVIEKRRRGRPRKNEVKIRSPKEEIDDVSGAATSSGKCASVQPGSDESKMDTTQSGVKGGAGSMVPKRKVGRPRKDGATPGTSRKEVSAIGVGVSTENSMSAVSRSNESATLPAPQEDVDRRGTNESAPKRRRGRPRKVGTAPVSPHEAVGASSTSDKRAHALPRPTLGISQAGGASSISEKSEINHRGERKALSNAQHEDGGSGSVKADVEPKPSRPRDEDMRNALRQFIAEDATSPHEDKLMLSAQRVNASENNLKNSFEKRKRGRPRKYVASSNDLPGGVTQGDRSDTEKVKLGGASWKYRAPPEEGVSKNKGKQKLGRPRKIEAPSDILPRNAPGDGSSSSFVKRKVGRPSKDEASPGAHRNDAAGEGAGSNAGKRKAGPLREVTEVSSAPPQDSLDGNGATINSGKRKAGPPRETEAVSAPPPQEGLDGNGATINSGKRKAGPPRETEAVSAPPPQEGFDGNGAAIDAGKRNADPSQETEASSASPPQEGLDGNGATIDTDKCKGSMSGKRKAGPPQEMEASSAPPPQEGLDGNGATMNSGKRKASGLREDLRGPDVMEEGGASSGTVKRQLGPTGEGAQFVDAPQAHVAGHLDDMKAGGKSKPGLPRKDVSMSDESSSAQEVASNGAVPTKRRGRGRPRKKAVAVDSRKNADESAASIAKKQRVAYGDPQEHVAVTAASGLDYDPHISPSSWALHDGHAEPSRASNVTSSAVNVESACPSGAELPDSAAPAESSRAVATLDDSNNDRAVSYIFTATGRKAVLKKGQED